MSELSKVAYQVMWNRLISVVEEQAQALVRTAFSTSVREAGDLSAGVYNDKGEMLAQAVTGTPGHVNAMAESVGHFIRRIGRQNMFEGDVYITNDPWEGTGHLHDITVVTPSFHKGRFVGFFACTAHVTDIGGRGFGADANWVYEEGLYIPIMKFAERGQVDRSLVHIIRGNVREPDQLIGDIYALATCNEVGHRRLTGMMDEFALAGGLPAKLSDAEGRAVKLLRPPKVDPGPAPIPDPPPTKPGWKRLDSGATERMSGSDLSALTEKLASKLADNPKRRVTIQWTLEEQSE